MIAKRVAAAVFSAGLMASTVATVAVAAPVNAAAVTAAPVAESASAAREGYTYNYYWYQSGCFSMGNYGQSIGMWGWNWICARQYSQYHGVYIYALYIA